jgi:hypothetical protein
VRQKRKGANGVIAATTPGAEERDLRCPSIECRKECELGVGRIFIGREAQNGYASRLKFVDVGGAERIKITDDLMQWQAEWCCVSGAAISSDDK